MNSCQLCKVEKLFFEPPPKYCSSCGARIKRNAPYYSGSITESGSYYFCVPCYSESRSDSILVNSIQLLKSKLAKKRNDDELEEAVSISVSLFPGCILIVMHSFPCILINLINWLHSGLPVTNVNAGSTRFVLFLMPKGMMKKKMQNIFAIVVIFKR